MQTKRRFNHGWTRMDPDKGPGRLDHAAGREDDPRPPEGGTGFRWAQATERGWDSRSGSAPTMSICVGPEMMVHAACQAARVPLERGHEQANTSLARRPDRAPAGHDPRRMQHLQP